MYSSEMNPDIRQKLTFIILNQTAHRQIPYLKYYNPLMHRFVVVVESQNAGTMRKTAGEFFDRFVEVDSIESTQTLQVVENEVKMVGTAEKIRIVCFDESTLSLASNLRETFAIPGAKPSDIKVFRNKIDMKTAVRKNGLRVPHFISLSDLPANVNGANFYSKISENVGPKFIIKPVAGFSSQNTVLISNPNESILWLQANQNSIQDFEAEEFIQGVLYHCDSIFFEGSIVFSEVSEYTVPCMEYSKGLPIGSIPLPSGNELRQKIIDFNAATLAILPSFDKVTHLEVFVTEIGEIVFLEIAARPPGAEVVPCLQRVTGINLYDAALQIALEEAHGRDFVSSQTGLSAAWFFFPKLKGTIKELALPPLECEYSVEWRAKVGDNISESEHCVDRVGSLHLWSSDYAATRHDFELLRSWQALKVDSPR